MSADRWSRLSSWHNAWLGGDEAERERLRDQLRREHPDLVAEAEDLIVSGTPFDGFLETPAFILAAQDIARDATELANGTTVGPYRVVCLLARGGMGEVYRATDVRLHRDVALKVMTPGLAADAQQVDRFLQEARITASLDHPNVVKVYDVGVIEDRPYLVAELLEGETLRSRLGRPMSVAETQRIAVEVTRGLVAAHGAGLVHRDMKPENIFLTRTGATKILDFGVAKLVGPPVAGAAATLPGVLLGTAGYLAPEQTSGEVVDLRADLFALGSIMFEMLTGERAFAREHTIDTLYAIRHDPAPDVRDRRDDVAPALAETVARLLEKSPDRRFQSSADLLWALEHVAAITPADPPRNRRPPAVQPRRALDTKRWRVAAIGMAVLTTAGVIAVTAFWPAPAASPQFERLTFRVGIVENARFVPGSEDITYSAAWAGAPLHVFVTRSGALDSRPLLEPTAVLRDIAPDGRLLLGVGGDDLTTLAVAPPTGRGHRELETRIAEAAWGRDGTMAVLREGNEGGAIEYPVGQTRYRSSGVVMGMRVSPDGETIAFIEHPTPGDSAGAVAILGRDGQRRVLSDRWRDVNGLAWSPDGREIYFSATPLGAGTSVHAVTLDGKRRLVMSAPGALALHDVSRDGRMLISRDTPRATVWVQRDGERPQDLSWFDWGILTDLSRDGRYLLIVEIGNGGGTEGALFLRPTDGGPAVRLASGGARAISPDGKWVVSAAGKRLELIPTGAGQRTVLSNPAGFLYRDAQFLPDGQRLTVAVWEPADTRGMWVRTIADETQRFITGDISSRPVISPGGDVVAFRDRRGLLVLHSLSSGQRQVVQAALPTDRPIGWSQDGRYIYAQTPKDQRGATRDGRGSAVCHGDSRPVEIVRIDTRTPARELLRSVDLGAAGPSCMGPVFISRDGKVLAYQTSQLLSDLYLVTAVH
jgi:Tol biopolymer transport system component